LQEFDEVAGKLFGFGFKLHRQDLLLGFALAITHFDDDFVHTVSDFLLLARNASFEVELTSGDVLEPERLVHIAQAKGLGFGDSRASIL
jgi:hypothetical protein